MRRIYWILSLLCARTIHEPNSESIFLASSWHLQLFLYKFRVLCVWRFYSFSLSFWLVSDCMPVREPHVFSVKENDIITTILLSAMQMWKQCERGRSRIYFFCSQIVVTVCVIHSLCVHFFNSFFLAWLWNKIFKRIEQNTKEKITRSKRAQKNAQTIRMSLGKHNHANSHASCLLLLHVDVYRCLHNFLATHNFTIRCCCCSFIERKLCVCVVWYTFFLLQLWKCFAFLLLAGWLDELAVKRIKRALAEYTVWVCLLFAPFPKCTIKQST